jgi:HEAT repeat protein
MSDPSNEPLSRALKQLVSDDVEVQNQGVETIVQIGARAVPALSPLLEAERADVRSQAMYALAQLAPPEMAQAFQEGLDDPDERVRARAAQGLVRIHHPQALAACIQTLNDAPDELHLDLTPAVHALGKMGIQAVSALMDLLMSEAALTRLRAQRALERIVSRRHGFRSGEGFPTQEAAAAAQAEWQRNGNYDYQADADARAAAVARWRRWLAEVEQ